VNLFVFNHGINVLLIDPIELLKGKVMKIYNNPLEAAQNEDLDNFAHQINKKDTDKNKKKQN